MGEIHSTIKKSLLIKYIDMSRETMQIGGGSNLKQTMLQGFNAMAGKDVPSYTLLFMDPTKSKMKGEYMNVVVPYVEVGRSPKCAIRYGEEFPTVSRVHASIQSIGKQVVIKHLGTNPTLVNNQPIHDTAVLQNGDEVQFSMEGPRLRFNTSAMGTSSMKFTQRMALYTSQALAPYKRGLMILGSLLVLTVAGFATSHYMQSKTIASQGLTIEEQKAQVQKLQSEQAANEGRQQQIRSQLAGTQRMSQQQKQQLQDELYQLELQNERINSEMELVKTMFEEERNKPSGADYLSSIKEDVYIIVAKELFMTTPGIGTESVGTNLWTGTGFLTADGRFITARHVIEPWKYYREGDEVYLNYLMRESAGTTFECKFIAYSPSGKRIEFSSKEMTMSTSKDLAYDANGTVVSICETRETDWAYMQIQDKRGRLRPNTSLAQSIKTGTEVHVYGYQYASYTQDIEKGLSPNYSSTTIAQDGLRQGVMQTTNRGFGSGSSGAPVVVEQDGEFLVVGIAVAGVGAEQGLIVPLSNLR
jgi:flagellar motor protein MotB